MWDKKNWENYRQNLEKNIDKISQKLVKAGEEEK